MRRRGIGRAGPGLLGTAARTAVAVKTADAVATRSAQRRGAAAAAQQSAIDQQVAAQMAAAAPAAPAAPAAAPLSDDAIARLKQLAELRDAGVLTDDEFAAQKAALLG